MAKFRARLSCMSHSFINRLSYPTVEMLAHPCLLVLFLQQQRNGISLSVPRFFCIAGSWTKGFSILSNLSRSIVLAVAWISSNRWMDNENVLYTHCGILFSYKQKRKQEICRKMGSPGNITLKEVTQSQINTFILSYIQILFSNSLYICTIYRYTYMYLCVSVGNGQKSRRAPNRWGKKRF